MPANNCPVCGLEQDGDHRKCPRCDWDFPVFIGDAEEGQRQYVHRVNEARRQRLYAQYKPDRKAAVPASVQGMFDALQNGMRRFKRRIARSGAGREELCPFCFEHFLLANTPFRCTNQPAMCPPERDPVLEKRWGDRRPVGKVLEATGHVVRSLRCQECGHESRKRLCPECHSELPHTTGRFPNRIFAIIGAKEAGKSHYLAVLIDELKKRIGPSLNILLEPMNDDTIDRYRMDFAEPIFRNQRVIQATKSAITDRKTRQPLIYSLTFTGRGIFGKRVIKDAIVLVFFDTAGENLNSEDVMSVVNKYIYRSDGILLLVDPLQLPHVRGRLEPALEQDALPNMNTETTDILTRTTRLIQKGLDISEIDQIRIPIALSFSKFDAVHPLVDERFRLYGASRHDGGFDLADFEETNIEAMWLLDDWGGQDIVQQACTRYRHHGFFGLTALGCNPHGSNHVPFVRPHRVEDPFLWLLYMNGLIPRVRQ
jgi:hypothetical protein